eukprot:6135235-Amphidinium_carterae.5
MRYQDLGYMKEQGFSTSEMRRRETVGTTSTSIECAIGDFIDIYLYNHPQEFPLQARELNQTHYLVIVHTTQRLVQEHIEDLKEHSDGRDRRNWWSIGVQRVDRGIVVVDSNARLSSFYRHVDSASDALVVPAEILLLSLSSNVDGCPSS